jgi:hypothetical protein
MGSFSIQLTEDAAVVLQRAEQLARSNGVAFQRDGRSGSFSHLGVKGAFRVRRNVLEVTYSKPMFISDAMVQKQIRQIIG